MGSLKREIESIEEEVNDRRLEKKKNKNKKPLAKQRNILIKINMDSEPLKYI